MPLEDFPSLKSSVLKRFNHHFVDALEKGVPRSVTGITGEKSLKELFIVEKAREVGAAYPHLGIYSPPWGNEKRCSPHTAKSVGRGVPGCPECWRESKAWASTDAWGMRHNFDLAIRDPKSEEAIVLEVKMFVRDRNPNGEMQRFLGQLLLARSKHPIVTGVCGRTAQANMGFARDTERVRSLGRHLGVELIFLDVP